MQLTQIDDFGSHKVGESFYKLSFDSHPDVYLCLKGFSTLGMKYCKKFENLFYVILFSLTHELVSVSLYKSRYPESGYRE